MGKKLLIVAVSLLAGCALARQPAAVPGPSYTQEAAERYQAPAGDQPQLLAQAPQPASVRVARAVPMVAAIAAESLASAPAVALAAATGGPIGGVWEWITSNPTAVGAGALGLVGLVFGFLGLLGKRPLLKPEHAAILAQVGPPLIEQGRALAERTKTPWDDQAVKVIDKLVTELLAAGTPKPAAVAAAKALVAKAA